MGVVVRAKEEVKQEQELKAIGVKEVMEGNAKKRRKKWGNNYPTLKNDVGFRTRQARPQAHITQILWVSNKICIFGV